MKKLAIFVEGETELEFMSSLLKEVASERKITIQEYKIQGGGRSSLVSRVAHLVGHHVGPETIFEAWIYNSSTDSRVNSDIRDQYQTLQSQGFSMILGLKDLRGQIEGRAVTHADLPKFELGNRSIELQCHTKHTKIVTAVMEIEAWFLAETKHFTCIDKKLTQIEIQGKTQIIGFDPFADDMTALAQPAEALGHLYSLVGKGYGKTHSHRKRTIECLDLAHLYLDVRSKIAPLDILLQAIDIFLTPKSI